MDHIMMQSKKLFDPCDQDIKIKGYLITRDLQTICPQLDDEEINFIFTTLDLDKSKRINRAEFLDGFQNALCHGENRGPLSLYIFCVMF
ncbi:hypothetical protein LOAG_06380 [Loa loa]|uniref:EF-hand domain-containing protein n=1 Tax=Loa loa TaxID=7209 RepID=A0A1S0TY99_LOALO|nr:hypothetical protein LOAG_06380 [Loa loa]EFO22107.1 hypothetical protein LOAG_06380 [Loa loa]